MVVGRCSFRVRVTDNYNYKMVWWGMFLFFCPFSRAFGIFIIIMCVSCVGCQSVQRQILQWGVLCPLRHESRDRDGRYMKYANKTEWWGPRADRTEDLRSSQVKPYEKVHWMLA